MSPLLKQIKAAIAAGPAALASLQSTLGLSDEWIQMVTGSNGFALIEVEE